MTAQGLTHFSGRVPKAKDLVQLEFYWLIHFVENSMIMTTKLRPSLNVDLQVKFLKFFEDFEVGTPRPRTALLMCLEKYSAIGISAIGKYRALYSKT